MRAVTEAIEKSRAEEPEAWARSERLDAAGLTGARDVVYGPKRRAKAEAELRDAIDTALDLLPGENEWEIAQRMVGGRGLGWGSGSVYLAAYAAAVRGRMAERQSA